MGISKGAIHLLAMTLLGDAQKGRAVTFGVQKLGAGLSEIQGILNTYGYQSPYLAEKDMGQTALFKSLGYRQIDSIDYYPDEGPSICVDLNGSLPEDLSRSFDLVYDGGTLEHCFDPAQVLRNTVALCAAGGRIIHHVPINNWVNHGFYQFSPTLFFDYYEAAGFKDLSLKIHFIHGNKESYISYDPLRDPPIPYALGGRRRVLAFFSARRHDGDELPVAPSSLIQGRYRATFGSNNFGETKGRKSFRQRLKASLRKRLFEWGATSL